MRGHQSGCDGGRSSLFVALSDHAPARRMEHHHHPTETKWLTHSDESLDLVWQNKPQYYPTAVELASLVHLSRPRGEEGWLFMHLNNKLKVVEDVSNKIKD